MKVRKLLELQSNIEERKVPCDLCDDKLNQHYSESKEQFQNILDMDLVHLVRSYSKCLNRKEKITPMIETEIYKQLNIIEDKIFAIREIFD
jgi:hypothetical protein|tara:strand:- start:269 stop:541 length:273 start_codon:yes stop_codon:yes gene_type:complete